MNCSAFSIPITMKAVARASASVEVGAVTDTLSRECLAGLPVWGLMVCVYFMPFSMVYLR